MGTSSCVTSASLSRFALSMRFRNRPYHCCRYSLGPCVCHQQSLGCAAMSAL